MPYIEHSITKNVNAFLNSGGGTLLVGVDDDGIVLGLENDYKTFKNGKDGFLLHFDDIINNTLGKEQHANISMN